MRLRSILAVVGLAFSIARAARAQNDRPVHIALRASRENVHPGDTARVSIQVRIDEYFHLYSTTQRPGGPVPTAIALVASPGWSQAGRLRAPPPDTIPDANFGIMSEVYDDSVTFGLSLVAHETGAESQPRIAVRYQACTRSYCLPARTDTFVAPVRLALVSAVAEAPPISVVSPPVSNVAVRAPPIEEFGGATGVGGFLWLAASMGLLALLTPCVFPMIAITITSAMGEGRASGIRRAAAYSLGIVTGFTGLGFGAAVLVGASGLARFSAHPAVNLAMAALFLAFSLSLIGKLPVAAPTLLLSRVAGTLASPSRSSDWVMGIVFTIAAFTCTAPFVGTLLVLSSRGTWLWPLVGMLVFSIAFAAPFFLLALVPSVLRRAPSSGDWMRLVEMVLGAIELGAAVKFASNADMVLGWGVLTRTVVIWLWVVILAALAIHVAVRRTGPRGSRASVSIASLAAAVFLAGGLRGRRLGEIEAFLPPSAHAAAGGELSWTVNDYPGALVEAARLGRPILIDFTGYTCTNCRWMEANMFPRDDVRRELDRFVRVRLYTDGVGEPYAAQQRFEERTFGTVALPLYAVLDPTGAPRARFLGMTRDAAGFADFLATAAR